MDERQEGREVWEEETRVLQADWSWTLAKLVQMICKEDAAAQASKDKRAEKHGRGQLEDAKDRAAEQSVAVVGKKRQPVAEEKEQEEEEEEVKTQAAGGLVIRVNMAADNAISASPTDAVGPSSSLSPAQQKRGSGEEGEEVKASAPSASPRQPKSPRSVSVSSSPHSQRRRSVSSNSPRRSPPAFPHARNAASPRPQHSAAERAVLSSFIPLPAHFIPSLLISSCGSSRVVWLDTEKEGGGGGAGGGQWLLSALRDRWHFGLEECGRVGVLVLLRLYGHAVWVKQRDWQRQSWTHQLRADDADGAEQQPKGKK